MTLGRLFEPADTGLLLAVCFDGDGTPKAFNHYVAAWAVGGFSLDVTRRTADADAPNGSPTSSSSRRSTGCAGARCGRSGSTSPPCGRGWPARTATGHGERTTLHHFSDTVQDESLWTFNEKYDPHWRPRYVVTDSIMNRPRAGLAIARAESVFERPVVGSRPEP